MNRKKIKILIELIAVILLYSTSICLISIFLVASSTSEKVVTISFNNYGEFWVEVILAYFTFLFGTLLLITYVLKLMDILKEDKSKK